METITYGPFLDDYNKGMPSPSDTYPHEINAEFADPLRTLYHPPDEATSPDEIKTKRKIFVDKIVTLKIHLGY